MGANPVVETLDDPVEPIMPDGMPTPTLPVDTVLVPGSSFTFTTAIISDNNLQNVQNYGYFFGRNFLTRLKDQFLIKINHAINAAIKILF